MGCVQSTSTKDTKSDPFMQRGLSAADLIGEKKSKITDDYTLLNPPLGKGAFGEVRKGLHKSSGLLRAVKIINKNSTSEEEKTRLVNEVNIMKNLDHPSILRVFEFYSCPKSFYIVTELCSGGELFDKIAEANHFDEHLAADYMKQILSAITYCHLHKIVHRDLKPENVLLESKKPDAPIKIIDFGTSQTFDSKTKMKAKTGTPYYVAPEVVQRNYDEKCDVWSCGVILYIMLAGYPPFKGKSDQDIFDKAASGKLDFPKAEWEHASEAAKALVKKMLTVDPKKRVSASEALNDPWIKSTATRSRVDSVVAKGALNRLKNFRSGEKLQNATWVFMVNSMSTQAEKEELLNTFKSLDVNGDGQLSRQELIEGYKKIMGEAKAVLEVDELMRNIDTNGSGSIDYSEFVIATMNKNTLLSKQRLEAAFKMFDKDGSGEISIEELKVYFGNNPHFTEGVWKDLVKEADQNGDGQISLTEFKEMMLKMMK